MATDLTVVAIPFYFGSMEVERRYLKQRAEEVGPGTADYTKDDTVASLTMGVASLLVPARHRCARAPRGAGQDASRATCSSAWRWARRPSPPSPTALAGHELDEPDDPRDRVVEDHDIPHGRGREAAPAGPEGAPRHRSGRGRGGRGRGVGVGRRPHEAPSACGRRASATTSAGERCRPSLAIVGWDFIYYWNHRFMHEVRALWAHHVVHHSSERYNLSTALRQPVADVLGVYLPYGLMARVGIRPALIEQARGVNLLYQYWIHTDAIRSLGAGEEVLNTPSHHRVHHGSNSQYLDRNHGSILIVWDRLFGTFQREDDAVVYGLTKNIDTYNPVRIASHEFADIVRDVAHSTTWRDRLSFVLRGPGWAYRRHAERAARRRQLTTSVQLRPHADEPHRRC